MATINETFRVAVPFDTVSMELLIKAIKIAKTQCFFELDMIFCEKWPLVIRKSLSLQQ